ncbi:MAG: hypothetical protein U1D30_15255 [Planctomycetota bacterium]
MLLSSIQRALGRLRLSRASVSESRSRRSIPQTRRTPFDSRFNVENLEERLVMARVVTIGDSWAWLVAANAPGTAPAAPGFGNSLGSVLAGYGVSVYNGSFGGGTAAQHAADLQGITDRINANPDAEIVYLSSGGNDLLLGLLGGGFYIGNPNNASVYASIANNVNTIVNHILSLKPDIQVVIAGYDYPNFWDGSVTGAAGDQYRLNYGVVRADTGNNALNQILNLQQNAQVNQGFRDAETGKISIANNSRRVHHVEFRT